MTTADTPPLSKNVDSAATSSYGVAMRLDDVSYLDDSHLASHLAVEAGRHLVDLRSQGLADAELRAAGDRASHVFLTTRLQELRPDDAVLSEEGTDDDARLTARRVWIVDPLDGTREYAEQGRSDWAVHVALWEGGDLTAGAVSLPAIDAVHSTTDPPVEALESNGRLRLAVSRSRPPEFVRQLADLVDADLVPMGSAGVKAMSVVRGETDAYVHAGGQYEWDSAAPVAVARAAGLCTSRLDGTPLVYNQRNPWLPDLIICRPHVLERLEQGLSRL